MLSLPELIKQHLLFSCLLISGALHGLVIFYPFNNEIDQPAKGEQHTLLLESSHQPYPSVKNEKIAPLNSSNIKQISQQQAPTSLVQAQQPENPTQLNTKMAPNYTPKPNTLRESSSNNINSNAGENLDMSGKELTAVEKYQKRVLQHILKKIGSAPYFGSARVELTLMRAGIATHIRVKLINGPSDYQSWLNHKILSANPMPAFPKNMRDSQLKLSFPIHHIKEL